MLNVMDQPLFVPVQRTNMQIRPTNNVSTCEKIVRPVPDSNSGLLAYRASALMTELTVPRHNVSSNVTKFTGRDMITMCWIDLNVSCNAFVAASQRLYKDAVCDGSTLVCACPEDRYADTANKQCLYTNGALKNDTYTVQNSAGQSYRIYYQFNNGYGYTFLSNATNVNVNMSSLYDNKSNVIKRHKRLNGVQYTSKISQLESCASTPVSVQYSAYNGYQASSSYIAFFFNPSGQGYINHVVRRNKLMYQWYDGASAVAQSEYLSDEFFTNYHEVHQVGCGGYSIGSNVPTGGAVGMKFTVECAVPAKVSGAQITTREQTSVTPARIRAFPDLNTRVAISPAPAPEVTTGPAPLPYAENVLYKSIIKLNKDKLGASPIRLCPAGKIPATTLPMVLIEFAVADVKIATSQNDVRFLNIEGNQTISINIKLADEKSITSMILIGLW
ncbi:hypothetical protein DPMN_134326 [Dreissena polymorpha]|uniref:Uncharacterized protein n=1 Tax=Dreissena polymorpha TaxID=45954 RepID=A0A9D4JAL7_DREPO|nr:hypothetical protein DPMN_134326 [Dreissena polymorpha]